MARITFALYLAFLASLPVTRPAALNIGATPVQLADVLLFLLMASVAAQVVTRRISIPLGRLALAAACFVTALLASLAANGHLHVVSLAKLAAYAMYIAVPLVTPALVTDERRLALALRAWFAGAVIAIVIGVAGIAAFYLHRPTGEAMMCGWGGLNPGNVPRVCAPFSNPNMFCNYLTVSAALALGVSGAVLAPRWAWALAITAGVVGMFTMSGGAGGFALAVAATLLAARRLRGQPLRLADQGLAAGALLVAAFFALSLLGTLQPDGKGNVPLPGSKDLLIPDGQRVLIWQGTMPTIRARPIIGIGHGELVSKTDDPRAWLAPDAVAHLTGPVKPVRLEAHDVWLSVLGQAGVVGLLAFVWLLYELARRLRLSLAYAALGALPAALLGAAIGAFLFHGVFAALEETRHLWAVFGFITAIGGRKWDASS